MDTVSQKGEGYEEKSNCFDECNRNGIRFERLFKQPKCHKRKRDK